jgi:hypothetical protein
VATSRQLIRSRITRQNALNQFVPALYDNTLPSQRGARKFVSATEFVDLPPCELYICQIRNDWLLRKRSLLAISQLPASKSHTFTEIFSTAQPSCVNLSLYRHYIPLKSFEISKRWRGNQVLLRTIVYNVRDFSRLVLSYWSPLDLYFKRKKQGEKSNSSNVYYILIPYTNLRVVCQELVLPSQNIGTTEDVRRYSFQGVYSP